MATAHRRSWPGCPGHRSRKGTEPEAEGGRGGGAEGGDKKEKTPQHRLAWSHQVVLISNYTNKMEDKFYFRHSGYAGGAKTIPFKRQMEKDPTKVIYLAVKRMIASNRLRDKRLKRLRVFPGEQTQFANFTSEKG